MDSAKCAEIAAQACHPDVGVSVKTRRWLIRTYDNCFVGEEMVSWIMKNQNCQRPAAIAIGKQLMAAGLIEHVVDKSKPFLDDYLFYRFTAKARPAAQVSKEDISRETLTSIKDVIELMVSPQGVPVKDRKWRMKVYKQCFVASEGIDWMLTQASLPIRSRAEGEELGEKLVKAGYIEHVVDPQPFKDAYLFFRFTQYANGVNSQGPAKEINTTVSYDDFDLVSVLGEGGYGKVMLVKKKDSLKIYAMKAIEKSKISTDKALQHILTEKQVLLNDHPFLLHLHFAFQSASKLFLVTDFLPGGDLFFHLAKQKSGFKEKVAKFLMAELVLALEHLHHCAVIYRDLKLENVLLDVDGHVCLADFGLSKVLDDTQQTQTFCGSQGYLAPEILKGEKYSFGVDWFSLGVMLYEMMSGNNPFLGADFQQTCRNILYKEPVYPAAIFSRIAQDLLNRLMCKDPVARLATAAEIKRHPFFKGIDWSKLMVKKIKPPFRLNTKGLDNFDRDFTNMSFSVDSGDDVTLSSSTGDTNEFDSFDYAQPELK